MHKKALSTPMALILVALIMGGALFAGFAMFSGQKSISPSGVPTDSGKTAGNLAGVGTCNALATNSPQIRPAVVNVLNTSGTEYLTGTLRVYQGDQRGVTNIPADKFVTTFSLSASGQPATGSGIKTVDCGQTYTLILPATDGTSVSSIGVVTMDANDKPITLDGAKQAGLIFRVYDENNRGYVYGSADTTAGSYRATATTFYSTTSNATGYAVSAGGNFKYSLYMKTNGTASTSTAFTDPYGKLLVAVDAQDLSQWQEPVISFTYGDVGKTMTKVSVPSKISNDAYDYAYEITESSGSPLVIAGTTTKDNKYKSGEAKISFYDEPKSGVDPNQSIKVGVFTSGWVKKTQDEGAILGYNKDDSSNTYVYTGQTVTFSLT